MNPRLIKRCDKLIQELEDHLSNKKPKQKKIYNNDIEFKKVKF